MTTITDVPGIVDRYFAAWNDTDPLSRLEAVARAWSLRCSSDVDSHHDVIRFGWEILDVDGGVALDGVDVAQLDPNGLLLDVRGFFGSSGA